MASKVGSLRKTKHYKSYTFVFGTTARGHIYGKAFGALERLALVGPLCIMFAYLSSLPNLCRVIKTFATSSFHHVYFCYLVSACS